MKIDHSKTCARVVSRILIRGHCSFAQATQALIIHKYYFFFFSYILFHNSSTTLDKAHAHPVV